MANGADDNDRLMGGKGDDDLTGGLGNDTFVFSRGFGHDTINDFDEAAGFSDLISFDKHVFKNFAAVLAASAQIGMDVVITKDAGNTIRLYDVQLINLNANDFSFF